MSCMSSSSQVKLHTAIISDLHLTDAEPSRPRTKPKSELWKKFKTKQFFIDDALNGFLAEIEDKAAGNPIELILNGDIFDFDSVMGYPEDAIFPINWIETRRGLFPKEEKSIYKIKVILEEHKSFIDELALFIKRGHTLVIIPGNHDVELAFEKVQTTFIDSLNLTELEKRRVRFVSWFYISNNDTLIEHGHQLDPYCLCENPLNPFLVDYNSISVRLPFGNVACRYIMNGLGLFNPHVDKNYIMSLPDYLTFFFKYLIRTQPLIMWTWLWGSMATLFHVTLDRFSEVYKPKQDMETIVEKCAINSKSTPYMVRRLQELFATPAVQDPIMIAKELWLDRAFLMVAIFAGVFLLTYELKQWFGISLYWVFLPLVLCAPFFLFYARSIHSLVSVYKEPDEYVMSRQAEITGVNRICYGHTHIARHEFYGSVEHLNSGSWSPGFTNVECTESVIRNNYIWISPSEETLERKAELCLFKSNHNDNKSHQNA